MTNTQAAAVADRYEKPDVVLNADQQTAAQADTVNGDTMKTSDPEFWRDLRPKSIVRLSDMTALKEGLAEGRGAEGEEYTVEWVYNIDHAQKLAEWVWVKMTSVQDEETYLLAMIVDGQVSLYIYYPAGGFESGSRQALIERGENWLFQPPENEQDFRVGDLAYTESFKYNLKDDDTGNETEVEYLKKPLGSMQGMGYRNPPEGRMLTTLTMYSTETPCHSPQAITMEIGAPDNEEGGLVSLYLGETVQSNEVSVLHV